ncbi:hypothetical protein PHLGIDRAFT_21838 [Phlebiopsis gigantea 11061_1 CR5-6]|uniref:Thioredoxin domain-containing protein n=1 Tax=Phlebiopsis gigantea (strain 11061_1 CR5-6) TaxID=745531 RepID=A0A0C3PU56_PHLG1|nr:hypothetical protein PHLGIDRAFT_21838 [Phlebiopsis gigantea 11061_1 CR5-6]
MRPGWTSPLHGQRVDLAWLDQDAFVHIRGTKDDWRSAKLLLIEFWASVFRHLSEVAANERAVKVVTFADEGIFNNTPTDVAALKNFIFARTDMNYPIFVDTQHVAYNALFKPGQNLSIPLVFMITVQDRQIRWVGNAEEMATPLADTLAALR